MKRSELERESDIEHLRTVALAQHSALEHLLAQLRKKCRELAKFTGNKQELQQTLALINTLVQRQATVGESDATKGQADNDANDAAAGGAHSDEPKPEPPGKRARTGPTPQPNLPRVSRSYALPADELHCPQCKGELQAWEGQAETSELIDIVEARLELVTVQRQKYRCVCQACIVTAPGPARAAAGSRYSLDLALKVVVDKYLHSLPLTRQTAIYAQLGFVTASSTLWDLVYQLGTRLAPVSDALLAYARQQPIIGIDQTSWPRLDDARRNPWQMWAMTVPGLGNRPVAVHRIRSDKGTDTMAALLGDFRGVIVCDQAATHGALAKRNDAIELAGCWAHIIRRFKAAAEDFPAATQAVDLIRALYDVDATLDDQHAGVAGLPADDARLVEFFACRAGLRTLASRDICAQLHQWLTAHRGPTSLSIHDAVEHTLKYWDRLIRFLDDPRIPIDNNATERAFRNAVVGRKNYYGAKSRSGTHVAATMFTLIETCKLNNVPVTPYLRAACLAADRGERLLPWQFAQN